MEEDMSDQDAFVRVSPRDGRYLELSNGRPYVPNGLNLVGAPPADQFETTLDRMAAHRVNYCRVWLNHASLLIERERTGVFDPAGAANFQRLLTLARERGIRVKLCLEYFRDIRPERHEWSDNLIHHQANGGAFAEQDGIPSTAMLDFLRSPAGEEHFIRKLQWYRDRVGDDPTVYGWELWNEVNCVGPMWLWAPWTECMLAELKRLFPRHLSLQSLGSFDRQEYRAMYGWLAGLAGNDVTQVHRYLDLGAEWEVCHGPVDVLAAEAVRELQRLGTSRPIILAESGAVEPCHSGPFKLFAADTEGTLLHDILWAPFMAGAAGAGQVWFWDRYVAPHDLWWQFDRFAEATAGIDPPAEDFEPLVLAHPRLRVYALRGRRTVLIWCRDAANDWQAELRDGVAPEVLTEEAVDLEATAWHWQERPRPDLTPLLPAGTNWTARTYDPWADVWADLPVSGNALALPPFQRSLVIRLESSAD